LWQAAGKTRYQLAVVSLGLINGFNSQLSFGLYNRSPESVDLNEEHHRSYYLSAEVGRAAPLPTFIKGGGCLSSGLAPAGSERVFLKPVANLEVKIATTVLAGTARRHQQENSSHKQAPASTSSADSRFYDRPEVQTHLGIAIRQRDMLARWNDFFGSNQTNIDSRDGMVDPDRIWSSDGTRSIRFGEHEGTPNARGLLHFHEETWYPDRVENVLRRVQK
jgi:hypothetical protein